MGKENKCLFENDFVIGYVGNFPVDIYQIVKIDPDVKKDWYFVTFQKIGGHPLQFNWLLDKDHLNQEEFTMGGIPHRIALYKRNIVQEPQIKENNSKVSTKELKELIEHNEETKQFYKELF